MVNIKLDSVNFSLEVEHDFTWLKSFGKAFAVFAQNNSGNINFGMDNGEDRYFIKVAGLKTIDSIRTPQEAIETLKASMPIYESINHKNLIKLIEHYSLGEIYVAVFKWTDGDCLFDHWNFDKYKKNPLIIPPAERFKQLPISKRIESADVLFSFLDSVSKNGYVGVDFYDGSIIYDFSRDTTTICDIDFFRKKPTYNNMGADYWGSKRFKAPEEYVYGAVIDEITNVFTLGALLLDSFFGNYSNAEVRMRYKMNVFTPCSFEKWDLSKECYDVALKSVAVNRSERYATINEFYKAWQWALFAKGV